MSDERFLDQVRVDEIIAEISIDDDVRQRREDKVCLAVWLRLTYSERVRWPAVLLLPDSLLAVLVSCSISDIVSGAGKTPPSGTIT